MATLKQRRIDGDAAKARRQVLLAAENAAKQLNTNRWHVGKEIPIVLIFAVLLQTAGGIWWMAQLSSKIDNAIFTISEFKSERYTREDSRRDLQLVEQKIEAERTFDRSVERRFDQLEARLDRLDRIRH